MVDYMKKLLFLILVLFLVSCSSPEPVVEEPIVKEEPVKEVKVAPEVKEAPVVENEIREGFLELEKYQGSAEEILFEYLDELDDEQFEKTRQRRYMKIHKKYEGLAQIYYPEWQELSNEFLEEEANMIGSVWAEANAGKSQRFEATLHDYRGVIKAKVIVKNDEVSVTIN